MFFLFSRIVELKRKAKPFVPKDVAKLAQMKYINVNMALQNKRLKRFDI